MSNLLGEHAVVIGGSIAGLTTARVLADYFKQVTVLERDHIDSGPDLHKSIPQGRHPHDLMLGGLRVWSTLYPGFTASLESMGGVPARTSDIVVFHPTRKAYSPTGIVREPRDFGWKFYTQSRGLLEQCLRQCTARIANVRLESDCALSFAGVAAVLFEQECAHGRPITQPRRHLPLVQGVVERRARRPVNR
jgi:2-polyprenyl-6-methoxyphenol hydroxylase-like FAD-dependent oxidoreductase